MKLRNKKTGAIYKIENIDLGNNADGIWLGMTKYNSLAELNEQWEDYEEPKEKYNYYYLDCDGEIYCYYDTLEKTKGYREVGNYFETREEAEKAVRKLKAWKRLKDRGFKFEWWKEADNRLQYNTITFNNFAYNYEDREQLRHDLDLLFGGEE